MSKCDKYSELLSAYADGELTDAEKQSVESHIQNCENCKNKLKFILSAKEVLKDSPLAPVPETLLSDFNSYKEKCLSEQKKVVPFYKNFRIYTSVAAIILFAVVLKSGLWQETPVTDDSLQNPQTFISPASESSGAEPALDAGFGAKTRSIEPVETENSSIKSAEKTDGAIVYVSEKDFEKATKVLSDGPYFYQQIKQRLDDNHIDFETNFLTLDEGKPYMVTVVAK